MRSQRVDKKTGSEGVVPKLSLKYVSLDEADHNAAADLPEADHNAAASAPEADAGPEAEGGNLREKLAALYSPYNTIMVVLLVVLHVPAFYFMFAKGASEAERLSNAEWEFGFFAGMDVLFVLNLNLKAHPNGRWYNTHMIILMLVCNIVLVCFGAMRASNDPSESQALKVVFAVVEVCAVFAQDGLYVRHLHITLDVAPRHEAN